MPILYWKDEFGQQQSKEFTTAAEARFEAAGLVDARLSNPEVCEYCGEPLKHNGTRRRYCGMECKYLAGVRRDLSGI